MTCINICRSICLPTDRVTHTINTMGISKTNTTLRNVGGIVKILTTDYVQEALKAWSN